MKTTQKKEKSPLIRSLAWNFRLYFRYMPIASVFRVITHTISESRGLINSIFIAVIVDELISQVQSGIGSINDLVPKIIILIAVDLLLSFNSIIRGYIDSVSRIKMSWLFPHIFLYDKLNKLGTETIEDSETQNLITRYQEHMYVFENFMVSSLYLVSLGISFLFAAGSLALVLPVLVPIIIISSIPRLVTNNYYIKRMWELDKELTQERRKAFNTVHYVQDPVSLKEINISGAFNYLKGVFENYVHYYLGRYMKMRNRWTVLILFNNIIGYAAVGIGYVLIFKLALDAKITIGQVGYFMTALGYMSGTMNGLVSTFSDIGQSNKRLNDVKALLSQTPKHNDGSIELEKLDTPPTINLTNASFKYPNTKRYIIKDLNFEIKPGEKIAIVGENGAGKTTLIKLITRLYQLSAGDIFINDKKLNDLQLASWYQNLGVLFQDYNTYEDLTVLENIAIGRIDTFNKTPDQIKEEIANLKNGIDMDRIIDAAKKADAYDFIQEYPKKFDQVLSEKYDDGIRPSTGQWQKIAIARFFYRNAPVLILDEPTASIDAVAEANIFNRIYKFIENKTVIIISHRFSTVRNADRIIVFDKGKIVEEGTHTELIKKDGFYAKAFSLQAKGYLDD